MTKINSLKKDNIVIAFLREVKTELGLVAWPTKVKTRQLTIMVIIVTTIVGAYLGGLDYLLAQAVSLLLKR